MEYQSELDSIYKKVSNLLTKDEFIEQVTEKVNQMNGLCDEKTAAMLVANDLGVHSDDQNIVNISDISSNNSNVNFMGKVISVFDTKEFQRNDGTNGKVGNIIISDSTGSIKVTLWDEKADLIDNNSIKVGTCLVGNGYPKEGYSGLEVNIGNNNTIKEASEDIDINIKHQKIKEIKDGDKDINLVGKVLDSSDIREFKRKDGSIGKVCNLLIGDDSGKIRVTLWDEKTDFCKEIDLDSSLEIINAYARTNNFTNEVEVQTGFYGLIRKVDKDIEFKENFNLIETITPNQACSIKGQISGLDDIKEFTRKDGTEDLVANIYVSDRSGRIRLVLWGDNANKINEMDIGSNIEVIDAYVKDGLRDEIEAHVGNRSQIYILK
ncbi:OB-fold nucleic acid binding domain-containing protein [Methanosalsum natronophilum]|uniref:OB-fold nucleic acid binding domain-containing protein n=1 Tax=Methanosalsum natronophilum TaxID=768733 RepID=UPI002169DF3D|nr:OB-fold nucleic acid binding domain-containing protein [Methanosalsum natronophilum]MCS3923927.1 replication factor A1 [Methanosalsum natronophilum]